MNYEQQWATSTFENGFLNDMATSSLYHETAIPALKLTRSNSIIPQQLMDDAGSGGRERAALATVFGVPEYSESNTLWERQTDDDIHHEVPQYKVSRSKNHPPLPPSPPLQQSTFVALPTIPTVSRFNDLLIRDEFGSDLMFPSNASSGLLPSSLKPVLNRSDSSDTTLDSTFTSSHSIKKEDPTQASNIEYSNDSDNNNDNNNNGDTNQAKQVSTPLIFVDYPPTVFDLLKPDDDERIILWGPKITSNQKTFNPSSTSLAHPGDRPSLRGFSSNTTTTTATTTTNDTSVTTTQSRQDQGRPRILTGKLTDGLRKTLRYNNLVHQHSSTDNLKTILLLKRAFGTNRRNVDSAPLPTVLDHHLTDDSGEINRVIEAASVEKLVEKLTNTLDYEFMTDFFLTYRSFISPTQLCRLFILRFRWALENDNEDRKIVRIRTFVVMRHWLLNYFVHDFIPTRSLRIILTNFLNVLPAHPLVKSSPRDQRIVKGLKRVVRRLKRVYYSGSSQDRVHVIAPPPPSQDQGPIEELVRANLSHGLLRRKTALVRGVDVGGQHNGNIAVQDAIRAPMVVVGNLNPKAAFQSRESSDRTTLTEGATTACQGGSVASDDSLESTLSPGTTDVEDDYFDDDDDGGTLNTDELYQEEDSGLSLRRASRQQYKLERDRMRREKEEERRRIEFFSDAIDTDDSAVKYGTDGEANIGSVPTTPTTPPPDMPVELECNHAPMQFVKNNNVDQPPSQNCTRQAMDLTEDQAVALITLELTDGPLKKAAIGDTFSRIRRVPSRKWCQVSADEELSSNRRSLPPVPNKTLSADFIHQLNLDELSKQTTGTVNTTATSALESKDSSPVGLSRSLSRKSIERRKSERGLRELPDKIVKKSASTPSSRRSSMIMNDDTQDIPPLPGCRPFVDRSRSENTSLHGNNISGNGGSDDFEAIPYEQTVSLQPPADPPITTTMRHRRSLSKKFVNMVFSRSTSSTKSTAPMVTASAIVTSPTSSATTAPRLDNGTNIATLSTASTDSTPSPPPPPPPVKSSSPLPPHTSTFVSRIAQELHDTQINFEIQCDCVRCTGIMTGPRACRRFSMALLTDDDKRRSIELRQASINRGRFNSRLHPTTTQKGPMYLGQLGAPHSNSDLDLLQIGEISDDDDDDDDYEDDASEASSPHHEPPSSSVVLEHLRHSHLSNGSLDRLTRIATKGASVHRQSFSGESILNFSRLMDNPTKTRLNLLPSPPDDEILLEDLMKSRQSTDSSFILSYSSSQMAQQLCYIERDVLLGVDWEEMVHCRWTNMATSEEALRNSYGQEDNTTGRRYYDKQEEYGGIEQVIERFNTMCQWVASEIVSADKLDLRVKVVEKFIRLAQKCRIYSNFATLVQILLGLQSPSVSRLKRTWARVGAREQRLLDELSHFTSPMRNWKHIRDNMTMVADEYGMSPTEVQVEMPGTGFNKRKRTRVKIPFGGCIPFLGIYLSDLVFNSEQPPYLNTIINPTTSPVLAQPLVNFRKHRITATVIKRVLTFQNLARRYAFDVDEEVYAWCLLLDPLDAESIRRRSYALE